MSEIEVILALSTKEKVILSIKVLIITAAVVGVPLLIGTVMGP